MEIYALRLSFHNAKSLLDRFSVYVSADKRDKINKFLREEDAVRSLVAELLFRVVLCRLLGCTNSDLTLRLSTTAYGKPYIEGTPWHFNYSHSGEWIALVVDQYPVGIDIELIKKIDLEIAYRFFSTSECLELSAVPQNQKIDFFYSLWTLKESLIKADGRGLSIPLDSFSLSIEESKIRLLSRTYDILPYSFKQYFIDVAYRLSVCTSNDRFPEWIKVWDYNSFIGSVERILGRQ